MMNTEEEKLIPRTTGVVLHHTARFYDLLAWLLMGGREASFRERITDLAHLKSGEAVLDVGCGTGTLAITAKRRVGSAGTVYAIDASPEMIGKARKKAKAAGLSIIFKNEAVEKLPFADGSFDVVLSTLMLHHLPSQARAQCAREMQRVLKPGGRALVVDFAMSGQRKGLLARLHPRHGSVKLREIIDLLGSAGLTVIESGQVGTKDMKFVLAAAS